MNISNSYTGFCSNVYCTDYIVFGTVFTRVTFKKNCEYNAYDMNLFRNCPVHD